MNQSPRQASLFPVLYPTSSTVLLVVTFFRSAAAAAIAVVVAVVIVVVTAAVTAVVEVKIGSRSSEKADRAHLLIALEMFEFDLRQRPFYYLFGPPKRKSKDGSRTYYPSF